MKKTQIFILLLLILGITDTAPAQDNYLNGKVAEFSFEIKPTHRRTVYKARLSEAKLVSDLIEGFPFKWVDGYSSVSIEANCKGKMIKAKSPSAVLNEKQKNLLNTADWNSDINIYVNYTYKHPITHTTENNLMKVTLTLVTEKEAGWKDEKEQIEQYLSGCIQSKIKEKLSDKFSQAAVSFSIDANGKMSNVRIKKSSGISVADEAMLEMVRQMPEWKPAETAEGLKVPQEFEFVLYGKNRGGC